MAHVPEVQHWPCDYPNGYGRKLGVMKRKTPLSAGSAREGSRIVCMETHSATVHTLRMRH